MTIFLPSTCTCATFLSLHSFLAFINILALTCRTNGRVSFDRYVGMVTIILNDYPALKYVLVAVMGLFVLTNKE
jgi:hypothetical protein